jgi:CRISPR-associated protein Cas1
MREDLHSLPRVADSLSFLYLERCRVEQDARAIVVVDASGRMPVPCASLLLLLLGPGATITHAAVTNLADCGCTVGWVGEEGVRFYATGLGATRSSRNLLRQARLAMHVRGRLAVVRRMYELRFGETIPEGLSLQQIRGREGVRVRDAYARESARTGVQWFGRAYTRSDWRRADPVNRALSAANTCLYGVVHAAVVATGYSPAIGFIHTGKQLSFVYDIPDLYKTETSVPTAFDVVAGGEVDVERAVRQRLRAGFVERRLLDRIVRDIDRVLGHDPVPADLINEDAEAPGALWDPGGDLRGGVNWAEGPEGSL